jgi:diguanylate cyclase (GGDEF)-like protein
VKPLDSRDNCPERRREVVRHWQLAAILFIGGGLGAIPTDALHRPEHPPTIYLLPLLAIVSGLFCLAIANRAWERWLPVLPAVATLEIALTVWLTDDSNFAVFYILVAFYAAYVFRSRRMVGLQFGLAAVCALLPIAYDPANARETVAQATVLIPTLLLTAGAITFLREQLQASESRYRRLSESDPLTGVSNYRVLTERLPQELERHRRHGRQLALLLIDLDDFKLVNDQHGHQYGDRVLQEVAEALVASVRSHDIVVRHGGDEFSVIAPETSRERAEALCVRLKDAIESITVGNRRMSATTGCAIFPDDADSLNELLAHADDELLASKDAKPSLVRHPQRARV